MWNCFAFLSFPFSEFCFHVTYSHFVNRIITKRTQIHKLWMLFSLFVWFTIRYAHECESQCLQYVNLAIPIIARPYIHVTFLSVALPSSGRKHKQPLYFDVTTGLCSAGDIRISNQFVITRALHFAQPRCTTTPTVLSSKRNYHIGSQSII